MFVAPSKDSHTVCAVVRDKTENIGVPYVKGSKGVLYYIAVLKSLLLNAAGKRGEKYIRLILAGPGEEAGDGPGGSLGIRRAPHLQ